jgi:hypothetical protein
MAAAIKKVSKRRKEWYEVVEAINPYLFRIVTQDGYGTGFFLCMANNRQLCGVATAFHVIAKAFEWGLPIRIEHALTKKTRILHPNNRYIEFDAARDTAVIVFEKGDFDIPSKDLDLFPESNSLKVGCDVGWLGFPAVAPLELCFFSGHISNWNKNQHRYFVDGVAINGVSGGPVLRNRPNGDVQLIGIISAYIPNYMGGASTPGVAVVQDVSSFFEVIKKLKSLPDPQENPPPISPVPPATPAPVVEPKVGEPESEGKKPIT